MANNPKKVKDPTEVALSAIQEALNIGETSGNDEGMSSVRSEAAAVVFDIVLRRNHVRGAPERRPPGL